MYAIACDRAGVARCTDARWCRGNHNSSLARIDLLRPSSRRAPEALGRLAKATRRPLGPSLDQTPSSRERSEYHALMSALEIRFAHSDERAELEALQRRTSLVWEEYREQLLVHPDAIEL